MSEIDLNYIKSFSKHLKHNQTPAEKILWEVVRNKKFNNLKFHRQKPVFAYRQANGVDRFFIAELYCHEHKLIIEIDGSIHQEQEVIDYDQIREYLLNERGYIILRYTNDEIEKNLNGVVEDLQTKLRLRESEFFYLNNFSVNKIQSNRRHKPAWLRGEIEKFETTIYRGEQNQRIKLSCFRMKSIARDSIFLIKTFRVYPKGNLRVYPNIWSLRGGYDEVYAAKLYNLK